MPTFRDTEKQRYIALKAQLFSPVASMPGSYKGLLRDFCLADACAAENLHPALREQAIAYFRDRRIHWHDGIADQPSNHLCCSQSACVNTLWPLTGEPELLAHVFRPFLPELAEPLPFNQDQPLPDGSTPFLAFEWIGTRNYLDEKSWGTRGANATSADFAFRFRRYDGRIQLVLGEWKYTEAYSARLAAAADLNITRLNAYRAAFTRWQARQPELPAYESFFAEPFYQLMRLTLLAQEMEQARESGDGELEADIVSMIHIAPQANRQFAASLTSPDLTRYGRSVSAIWAALAPPERFMSITTESLLTVIEQVAPEKHRQWANDLLRRYGWWRQLSEM